jgi:hypothetical protein
MKLTWKVDGNAVEWRLNGVLIARTKIGQSRVVFGVNFEVLRAIRAYSPENDSLIVARQIWEAKQQDPTDALYKQPIPGEPLSYEDELRRLVPYIVLQVAKHHLCPECLRQGELNK